MSQCYRAAKTVPVAYARLVGHCVERVERVVDAERSTGGKAEQKKSMQRHRRGPPMRRHQEIPQTTPPEKSRGHWTKFRAFGMHAKTCRRCKDIGEESGAKTSDNTPGGRSMHKLITQHAAGLSRFPYITVVLVSYNWCAARGPWIFDWDCRKCISNWKQNTAQAARNSGAKTHP